MRGKRFSMQMLSVMLAIVALLGPPAFRASANGVPIEVFLSYLPDISNWGPEDAVGQVVVSIGEGWVTIEVQGLPPLEDEVYVAWIVPKTGAAFPVGKFNTDAAGGGVFELRDLSLPREPYRLFLITVEPDLDEYPAPGGRRSIAGRFPDPELLRPATPAPPTATPGPEGTGGGGNAEGGNAEGEGSGAEEQPFQAEPSPTPVPIPAMLPVTGGVIVEDESNLTRWRGVLTAAGGLLLLGLSGAALARRGGWLLNGRRRGRKGGGS